MTISHIPQAVPPAHADLRTRRQHPRCSPFMGTERVNRTDVEAPCPSIWRASTYVRHGILRTALREDRTGRCGATHAPPQNRPGKVIRLRYTFDRPFRMATADDALPAAAPCMRLRLPPRTPQPLHPLYPRGLVAARAAAARMNKRIVFGVDAFWDVELKHNYSSLDLAPACGDMSSKRGREEGELSLGHRARHGRRVSHRSRDRELIRRHGRRYRAWSALKAAAGLALRCFGRGGWFRGFPAHWLQVLVSNM